MAKLVFITLSYDRRFHVIKIVLLIRDTKCLVSANLSPRFMCSILPKASGWMKGHLSRCRNSHSMSWSDISNECEHN